MWFNYGNANGFDFWNNSDAIKPEDRGKDGNDQSGKDRVDEERPGSGGVGRRICVGDRREPGSPARDDALRLPIRRETTRIISQITTLQALDQVVFHDDKGSAWYPRRTLARVGGREGESTFTDASGRRTTVPNVTMPGATGVYLTSEGKKGDQAWGTRGRWCTLSGSNGNDTVTVAIIDHPGNPNYPTYWHARGTRSLRPIR